MRWKDVGVVRKSTYHKLKNLLLKLAQKQKLTTEEKKLLKAIQKEGFEKEVEFDSNEEGLEQIEDELNTLRTELKNEQVARADVNTQLTNLAVDKNKVEQKLKEAEENQRKSEVNLATERERVAQLEKELEIAQAEQNTRQLHKNSKKLKRNETQHVKKETELSKI